MLHKLADTAPRRLGTQCFSQARYEPLCRLLRCARPRRASCRRIRNMRRAGQRPCLPRRWAPRDGTGRRWIRAGATASAQGETVTRPRFPRRRASALVGLICHRALPATPSRGSEVPSGFRSCADRATPTRLCKRVIPALAANATGVSSRVCICHCKLSLADALSPIARRRSVATGSARRVTRNSRCRVRARRVVLRGR